MRRRAAVARRPRGRRPARTAGARGFARRLARALSLQQRRCEAYRRLCAGRGWRPPASLGTPEDLARVPFLPAQAFKRSLGLYPRLLNVPPEKVAAWTASSRTAGDPSLVGLSAGDRLKARRAFTEFGRRFGHLTRDVALIFFRDPARLREEAGREGDRPVEPLQAQLMEEFAPARERRFLLPEAGTEPARAGPAVPRLAGELGAALRRACERDRSVFVGGLAPILAPCLEALEAAGFRAPLPPGGILMLAGGGWDGRKGALAAPAPVDKGALVDCAGRVLGLGRRHIVDLYGLAESPVWCAGHFSPEDGDFLYHIPPWARVLLRDPATLDPIAEGGRPGLLEVLTWKGVESYPGAAILADDLAAWSERTECPVCRRPGALFRILGRAGPAESARAEALAAEIARLAQENAGQ